jgi:anti-sigma B factor antagonist
MDRAVPPDFRITSTHPEVDMPPVSTRRRPVFVAARSRRPPPAFAIHTNTTDAVARVAPAGELDVFTAAQLRDTLARLPQSTAVVILDLRGLTFCDTAGVHAIDDDARLRGTRLVMVPAPYPAHAVFELTGVGDHFEFVIDPGDGA